MRKLKQFIPIFLLIFCASLPLAAQDRKPLLENIESTLTYSLPKFSLKHKYLTEQTVDYAWIYEKSIVLVSLEFGDSISQARGTFSSKVHIWRMHGFDVKVPDERLSSLGFDNYWSEDVPRGDRSLHFYRGKVAVVVTAPTDEVTEMVARQIDALLPDA